MVSARDKFWANFNDVSASSFAAEAFDLRFLEERPQSIAPEHDDAPFDPWVPA